MAQGAADPIRRVRVGLLLVMLVAVAIALLAYASARPALPVLSYGEFLADVGAGRVDRVVQRDQELTVTEGSTSLLVVVPSVLTDVYRDMQDAATQAGRHLPSDVYEAQQPTDNSWIGLVLSGLLPIVVVGGFVFFLTRRTRGAAWPLGPAGRLEQLDEARRLGRITAQEYADKRAEILKSL